MSSIHSRNIKGNTRLYNPLLKKSPVCGFSAHFVNDASHFHNKVKHIGPTWPAHDSAVSSWCTRNSVSLPTFTMTAVFSHAATLLFGGVWLLGWHMAMQVFRVENLWCV